MAILSTYPVAVAKDDDLILGTQVGAPPAGSTQINPTKNFTIASIRDLMGKYMVNGLVNNLASGGGGSFDFMEWTSNITSPTQIPMIKLPQAVQLKTIAYTWMGDTALNIAVGDQVAFDIGTIAPGLNPVIANYVPVKPLFQLTSADNGTYANAIVDNINQDFNAGDQIAVVGTESGTVTPNTGELAITFIFQAKI